MFFLIVLMMLFSPFGIALYVQATVYSTSQQQLTSFHRQTTPQELFPIDAITVDLAPLDEMITNMHAFVDAAKAVYTDHFVENHFNTFDIPSPWMSAIISKVREQAAGLSETFNFRVALENLQLMSNLFEFPRPDAQSAAPWLEISPLEFT
jgi:hypothetical protein